jgi:hypothetical protein
MGDDARVTGGRVYRAALDQSFRDIERATYRATTEAAAMVERTGKRLLRTHTHPLGTPTTSPVGDPPALVTGNLVRSWRSTPARRGRRPNTVEARSGPTAAQSRIQELGGVIDDGFGRGVRIGIPARPFVGPAARKAVPAIRRIYVRRWTEAILS